MDNINDVPNKKESNCSKTFKNIAENFTNILAFKKDIPST